MKLTLTLFSVLLYTSIFSQDFSKRFEHDSEPILARAISSVDQYHTLVAGHYGYNNAGFLAQFNESGTILWQKWIDWQADSLVNARFFEVVPTPDSAYLISAGAQLQGQLSRNQCIVLKVNTDGDVIWQKRFEGQDSECYYAAIAIQNDSSYWVSWGGAFGGQRNDLVQLDINGSLMNAYSNNYNYPAHVSTLNLVDDTTLLIGGRVNVATQSKAYITKMHTNGTVHWTKVYDSLRFEDIVLLNNAIYAAAFNETLYTTEFLKIDSSGTMLWHRLLNNEFQSINDDKAQLIVLEDSTFITYFQRLEWYPYAHHIDSNGVILGTYEMEGKNGVVMPNSNGGATFLSNGPLYGVKNMWDEHFAVVRMDSVFYTTDCFHPSVNIDSLLPTIAASDFVTNSTAVADTIASTFLTPIYDATITQTDGCALFIGNVNELEASQFTSVYPNISDGTFYFEFNTPESVDLTIYSSLGTPVYTKTNIQLETKVDLSNYSDGAYYFHVIASNGRTNNGKLILQK